MALKTSLVISGNADEAVNALQQTDAALARNADQAKRLTDAFAETDKAIARVAAAQVHAAQETAATKAAFVAGEITQREYNARLLETKTALSLVEGEHRQTVTALRQAQTAMQGATVSVGQAHAGYVNLGRQMQDVAVSLQGGMNLGTIVAQQGGQIADAVAQMGGRFAGFAEFMAGPWGAAITVGIGVLLNFLPAMMEAADAADNGAASLKKVELASNGLSDAQSVLGQMFDLVTGKIKSQNEMLILNARLAAINLRAEALGEKSRAAKTFGFQDSNVIGMGPGHGTGLSTSNKVLAALGIPVGGGLGNADDVGQLISDLRSGKVSRESALQKSEKIDFSGLAITKQDLQQAIIDDVSSSLKSKTADLIDKSLDKGALAGDLRKSGTGQKSAAKPKGSDMADIGDDTERRIAALKDQFLDLPAVVGRTNNAMRDLDKIAADIARRKPPNLKVLLADIADARVAINNGLNKPFNDYVEAAAQAAQIDQLLVQGKDDQAEALKVVLSLEKQQKPLTQEQLDTVQATVQAERERAMVLRDQRAIIQSQVRAVQDVRGALEQTVADALKGNFSVSKVLSSIGNSYINITAQKLVEGVFGNTLRALEDQASGITPVKQAGIDMAAQMKAGGAAVKSFADVVDAARRNIARGANGGSSAGAAPSAAVGTDGTDGAAPSGDEIVVTGKKPVDISGTGNLFTSMVTGLTADLGIKIPDVIGEAMTATLGKLEKSLPAALAGAFTGASASRILLGDRGAAGGIGGAIGGAIGQKMGEKFLTKGLEEIGGKLGGTLGQFAGPLGSVLGGVLGGVIGGLFATKPRGSGSVTQNAVQASGSTDAVQSGLNTMGGQIQQAVQTIADKLGATVGNYEVGIGQYKDYYQVSNKAADPFLGQTYYAQKSSQALYDGKDAAAALSAAIGNAVADGAIVGVSAKVAAALKSSTDIDKAIREALKVQDVELALGGIGAELKKQFHAFELQAQERMKIAAKYGFDTIAMEKRNADDRLKLQEKLVKQQVGSLQQLIDDMTSGNLFEGSAVDQRKALLAKIGKARTDANAGVEGAADTLNQLLQQLNTVSKDAYGTTGAFASDRKVILDSARTAIAKANQRVTAAEKSDPALAETNAQLNESNDLLAKLATQSGISIDLLKRLTANSKATGFADLIRQARI